MALCFPGYRPDELSAFFKLTAANRGVHVQFFSERAQALQWLGVAGD